MDSMTDEERASYTPPPCPDCGATPVVAGWDRDYEDKWFVTELRCPNEPHEQTTSQS